LTVAHVVCVRLVNSEIIHLLRGFFGCDSLNFAGLTFRIADVIAKSRSKTSIEQVAAFPYTLSFHLINFSLFIGVTFIEVAN